MSIDEQECSIYALNSTGTNLPFTVVCDVPQSGEISHCDKIVFANLIRTKKTVPKGTVL
jgi:hypothetical protein